MGETDGYGVQRSPGEVHHLFVFIKNRTRVFHLKRVRQFHTEFEIAVLRNGTQVVQHRYGIGVFEVVLERHVGHHDVAKLKIVIQDRAHTFGAEQGRIAFDERVQLSLA